MGSESNREKWVLGPWLYQVLILIPSLSPPKKEPWPRPCEQQLDLSHRSHTPEHFGSNWVGKWNTIFSHGLRLKPFNRRDMLSMFKPHGCMSVEILGTPKTFIDGWQRSLWDQNFEYCISNLVAGFCQKVYFSYHPKPSQIPSDVSKWNLWFFLDPTGISSLQIPTTKGPPSHRSSTQASRQGYRPSASSWRGHDTLLDTFIGKTGCGWGISDHTTQQNGVAKWLFFPSESLYMA